MVRCARTPMRSGFNPIIRGRKTYLKPGLCFVVAHTKDMQEGNFHLPPFLPFLAIPCVLLLRHSLDGSKAKLFGTPIYTDDEQPFRNPQGLKHHD